MGVYMRFYVLNKGALPYPGELEDLDFGKDFSKRDFEKPVESINRLLRDPSMQIRDDVPFFSTIDAALECLSKIQKGAVEVGAPCILAIPDGFPHERFVPEIQKAVISRHDHFEEKIKSGLDIAVPTVIFTDEYLFLHWASKGRSVSDPQYIAESKLVSGDFAAVDSRSSFASSVDLDLLRWLSTDEYTESEKRSVRKHIALRLLEENHICRHDEGVLKQLVGGLNTEMSRFFNCLVDAIKREAIGDFHLDRLLDNKKGTYRQLIEGIKSVVPVAAVSTSPFFSERTSSDSMVSSKSISPLSLELDSVKTI